MPFSTEKSLETTCTECGQEHDKKWNSSWDEHSSFLHYKSLTCSNCGYEIHIKTNFDTSNINHF